MTTTDVVVHEGGVLSLSDERQKAQILQALGLDMRQPLTQALILVAQRYDLDPLLKQVQIIKGNVYITHAGLLHIAHASGKLDGIVVESEGVSNTHFQATVTVYRKDMSHGFTYPGEYAKSKVRSDGASGREMALKNAERSALRRAFDITAPTMDDSGADFDDVPPGTDIDIPAGAPALPTPEANALPVPEASTMTPPKDAPAIPVPSTPPSPSAPPAATTPTTPASAANGAGAATKVTIPETGEVVLLSQNGHVVNEKTGGEVFPATTEQEKLQARAREIVKQAEADLEKKVATPGAKRVAKAVAKKAAAKAEPTYTDEEIKRGQSIHMKAKELNVEETLMRDVVYAVTSKRTRSTREVSHDEADTIKALMAAIASEVIDLTYDEEGILVFDMMENPLPPDDADPDDGIVDAEVVVEPVDWKAAAKERSIKDGMFLRKARALAEELDLPLPAGFADIKGDKLEAALWEWLEEVNA